jgi:hypothetical protein
MLWLIPWIFATAQGLKNLADQAARTKSGVNNLVNKNTKATQAANLINLMNQGILTHSHHTPADFTVAAGKTGRTQEFFDPGSAVRTACAAATTTKPHYNSYISETDFYSDKDFSVYIFSVILEHGEVITSFDNIETNVWDQIFESLDTVDNMAVEIIDIQEAKTIQPIDQAHPYQARVQIDLTKAANKYADYFNKREMQEETTYNSWTLGILVNARPETTVHSVRRTLTAVSQDNQALPV